MAQRSQVFRVRPHHYMHVKDTNTGIVSVVTGAIKFTCLDNHEVVLQPTPMIIVPPRHYVIVDNPVVRKTVVKDGKEVGSIPVTEKNGQVMLRHNEQEIRFNQPPFPLYDGEIAGKVTALQIIAENSALLLEATLPLKDHEGNRRRPGEQWYFKGPGTYYPQVGVKQLKLVSAVLVRPDEPLKVTSNYNCLDYEEKPRRGGEQWLVEKPLGTYLPQPNETILEVQKSYTLSYSSALKLKANTTFDHLGVERKAGEEYLISRTKECHIYTPSPNETVLGMQPLTVLKRDEYCDIVNPYDAAKKVNDFGKRKRIIGPTEFFLQPGETIINSKSILLAPEEALWVRAIDEFQDGNTTRKPGTSWLVKGPRNYFPPPEALVESKVRAFLFFHPWKIYYFQPVLFFWSIIVIAVGLMFLFRFLGL